MITATPDGRRLRIHVVQDPEEIAAGNGIDDFLVNPLPAKRGLQLSRQYVANALGTVTDLGLEPPHPLSLASVMVEAFGAENYERMTGNIVIPTEPDSELRQQHDVRFIEVSEHDGRVAGDGEPMRHEEMQQLLQVAFYWQSVAGIGAVNAYIENTDLVEGKALGLLLRDLGIQLSTTSRSGVSENQTQQADTPDTTTRSGTSSSVVLPPAASPAGPVPRTPMDHQPRRNRLRLNSGRG